MKQIAFTIFLTFFSLLCCLPASATTKWVLVTGSYTFTFTQIGGTSPTEEFSYTQAGSNNTGTAYLHTNSNGFVDMQQMTGDNITCDYIGQMTSATTAQGKQICPTGYYGTWNATITNSY